MGSQTNCRCVKQERGWPTKGGCWPLLLNIVPIPGAAPKPMSNFQATKEKVDSLKVCILIPTYSNAGALEGVIADVSCYTQHVIVINNGTTGTTPQINPSFPFAIGIGSPVNKGKGIALREAFTYAAGKGYDYAITIDANGQNFAKEIPAMMQALEFDRAAIVIGARNMDRASIPGKSSLGHKLSNFWFKVQTGITNPDTQCSFRLYPLYLLKNRSFITRKNAFETEVLVRSAWSGISITSVPVNVHYAPKGLQESYSRQLQNFTRGCILHMFLVIIAFAYIKPRNFFRVLFNKKKFAAFIVKHLFNPHQSNKVKAMSIGFGVFMGIIPIWGFQLLVSVALAALFRLNKVLVVLACNISIPPMIPLIIFLSYRCGGYWQGGAGTQFAFSKSITLAFVRQHLGQYIYGSITLATAAGLAAGLLTLGLLKLFKRKAVTAVEH